MFNNRFGKPNTKDPTKEMEHAQPAAPQSGRINYDTPMAADTLLIIINGSIQSRQPLYLVGANINGASLPFALLLGAKLANAKLNDANLQGAYLVKAWLPQAEVKRADLRGAHLSEAVMNGANLRLANLHKATLSGVSMQMADLRGANLTGANLNGAHLQNTKLQGADLYGADLEDANLQNAKYTTVEDTFEANMDNMPTIWPEGFDPEAQGCKLVR